MNLLYRYIIKSLEWVNFSHAAELKSKIVYNILKGLGFEIDTVSWTKREYKPSKQYDVVFDIRHLHKLSDGFKDSTVKILYLTASDDVHRNEAELERVRSVNARRGCSLIPRRQIADPESVYKSIEAADYVLLTGNEVTKRTYPQKYHHKIHTIDTIGLI